MSKIPYVERAYCGMGLTGECAYVWACFLANEAGWSDDPVAYDKWKAMAETLQPKEGKPMPAAVHYSDLEDEISKYEERGYINPANCAQE